MARYNKRTGRPVGVTTTPIGYISTDTTPSGRTFEGAPGFGRNAKSELFLLAVNTFLTGDRSFYEDALTRDKRFQGLVASVAVTDPKWTHGFLRWLRTEGNIRTAAVIGAVEASKAMVKAKIPGSRDIVRDVLVRAEEPAEMLAYWFSNYKGQQIPKPLKRGIADAAQKLYTEYNYLKYDSNSASVSFADVLQLCHVQPSSVWQDQLFVHVLNQQYKKDDAELGWQLRMIRNNQDVRKAATSRPEVLLDPETIRNAGMTWEAAQSLLGTVAKGNEMLKRRMWEALVPNMGYMALLRNLRNINDIGVSDAVIRSIIQRLENPEEVARSRQFPFRFLSAYLANKHSLTWASALERALQHSLQNVPELPGRTLILVDISGSMDATTSYDSAMTRAQLAGLFGTALAVRNRDRATLVKYDSVSEVVNVRPGASILTTMKTFVPRGGTYTAKAVRENFRAHDRVIILTDEQSGDGDPGAQIPADVPLYTWNLAGYKYGHAAGKPLRYTLGGLTDQAFRIIPLLEAGYSQKWPWETGVLTPEPATVTED